MFHSIHDIFRKLRYIYYCRSFLTWLHNNTFYNLHPARHPTLGYWNQSIPTWLMKLKLLQTLSRHWKTHVYRPFVPCWCWWEGWSSLWVFQGWFLLKKLGLKRHPLPVRLEYTVLVLVVLCRWSGISLVCSSAFIVEVPYARGIYPVEVYQDF